MKHDAFANLDYTNAAVRRASIERRVLEVVRACTGVTWHEVHYALRPTARQAEVRSCLERLVRKGVITKRKRDTLKHLPWQKTVPIRVNVYHSKD